jgi:ubiquitin-like 1-activating enzyme E1 B
MTLDDKRESYNIRILGQELYQKVATSKILLVGAGGIGCELLKNLVMSGFKDIQVVKLLYT